VTRHRIRVLEALVALAVARLALLVLPFAWITRGAGRFGEGGADDRCRRVAKDPVALNVRRALRAAARRLPWRSTCLTKALAGRMMLMRRRTPSTLVFGVAASGQTVSAHAWLMTADGTVCGGREASRFRPLAAIRS
jgi:hypothetical protein